MNFKTIISSTAISAALLAASSAAFAQDISCTAKLAELTATQQTFEAQLASIPQNLTTGGASKSNRLHEQIILETINLAGQISGFEVRCKKLAHDTDKAAASKCHSSLSELRATKAAMLEQLEQIPATISTPITSKPNRLYEQIMLENITALTKISRLKQECAQSGGMLQTADSEQVTSLRAEITSLKGLVADLALENKNLRALVEQLPADNSSAEAAIPCNERRELMIKKLDTLRSLGYTDNHPDVKNVKHQLDTVGNECSASSTKG